MPSKNPFDDDVSVLSDDRFFSRKRRTSMPSTRTSRSSQSVTGADRGVGASPSKAIGFMKTKNPLKGLRRRGAAGIDDVSVSDSLCSGVLRDFDLGSTFGSGRTRASFASLSSIGNSGRRGSALSSKDLSSNPPLSPTPEPEQEPDAQSDWDKKPSEGSSLPSAEFQNSYNESTKSMEAMSYTDPLADDALRREQRKERVKEKLDKYKRDQKQMKKTCRALEEQLAQTTDKLREVDSRAAFKIDSLESELRETQMGMERVAKTSSSEVSNQSECIKALGKKLIRQAHVIKRQKQAVEQYKIRLEGMSEEMAMQDERDGQQEEEYNNLLQKYETLKEDKVKMQNLLQENIEDMMKIKGETESDAKRVMELEFNLQQKDATLERVAAEKSENSKRICDLEEELDVKTCEAERLGVELEESKASVEKLTEQLESAKEEVENLSCNFAAWGNSPGAPGEGGTASAADRRLSAPAPSVDRRMSTQSAASRRGSSMRWLGGKLDEMPSDAEALEEELRNKDDTIQNLDNTVKEHEETIKTLRSDMVKMSSTYKQDSYLKRKEIAKLKQMNAEYALKLRALEKAFKCKKDSEAGVSSSMHGHTAHGGMGSPSLSTSRHDSSRHGKSMHSVGSMGATKEDKAAAVRSRLGGFAPYEFPSADQLRAANDSKVVSDANFFEGSDQASEDGRKGELPEEC